MKLPRNKAEYRLRPARADFVASVRAGKVAIASRAGATAAKPVRASTMREVLRAYADELARVGQDADTVESAIVCWLEPAFGHLEPRKCTPPRVRALVEAMLECGLANNTVRARCSSLKSALTYAVNAGLIARSPLPTLRGLLPKKRTRPGYNAKRQVLSLASIELVVCSPSIPRRERTMYLVAAAHGLRVGELLELRLSDIQREAPDRAVLRSDDDTPVLAALHITRQWSRKKKRVKPPKGGGPRMIAMRPDVLEMLDSWMETGWFLDFGRRPASDDLLFPELRGGRLDHQNDRTVLKRFHRYLKAVGLERRNVHAFRHTFMSMLIDAGVAKDVAAQFTHPSPCRSPSDVYAHYSWRVLCEAVLRIKLRFRDLTDQLEFAFDPTKKE